MDAITILRDDHRAVDDLFKKFEALGERAKKSKSAIVDKIVRELSIHAAIEEQLLYPVVRERLPDKDEMALEALEEHLLVKIELSALQRMSPDHERYDAKVTVLAEVVRHHVKEEEKEMFPALRQVLSRTELRDLGEALQVAKKSAPTRPHPLSPDEPPGNVVVGAAAALVDRALDTGKHAVSRVRSQAR